jgi:hypothetical protein
MIPRVLEGCNEPSSALKNPRQSRREPCNSWRSGAYRWSPFVSRVRGKFKSFRPLGTVSHQNMQTQRLVAGPREGFLPHPHSLSWNWRTLGVCEIM